jgi:hypothetical protein
LTPKVSEAQIERTCTQFLELDGWRALKTDPVSRKEWGKGFGEIGMADRLYIRYANLNYVVGHPDRSHIADVMWIEWKRIRGTRATKTSAKQDKWHRAERLRGALTLIAGVDFPASIEGFQELYRKTGLCRRVR